MSSSDRTDAGGEPTPETITSVDFYWRPGCPFCWQLERALGKANVPITHHNIWEDQDAAAFVRSVADGNETVPTVSVGGESLVNPSARNVAKLLEKKAPHLLSS